MMILREKIIYKSEVEDISIVYITLNYIQLKNTLVYISLNIMSLIF